MAVAQLYVAIYSLIAAGIDHTEQRPQSRHCAGSEPVRPLISPVTSQGCSVWKAQACPAELGGMGYRAAAAKLFCGAARKIVSEPAKLIFSSRGAVMDQQWTVPSWTKV